MKYSEFFLKTSKSAKEYESVNATLLQKGGFVQQTMAGVYTFLPIGLRVLNKIENIVREEMDKLGSELLMPALSPQEPWEKTGRLESVDVNFEARGGNDLSRQRNDATYVLNSSHEDVLTWMVSRFVGSYKDFPFAVYQIQSKFRNEPRAKSGLLRGREFRMKDLYSFHTSEEDFDTYYARVVEGYKNTFDKLGLGQDTVVALASGGDFSKTHSHEFQTRCETGEDVVYFDSENNEYYNQEIAPESVRQSGESFRVSEVGNLYRLGTKYSAAFDWQYTDDKGKKQPIFMGSYGIGTSRVMGVLVEKFHDDRGIIWPAQVAPFQVYLAELGVDASKLYQQLIDAKIEVLYDDRTNVSAGEKLADADLLGIPWRVVSSKKTGELIEVKKRSEKDFQLMEVADFINTLK